MIQQRKNLFCFSAGVVLFITGTAKIWSTFGHARVLLVPNPLLGLKYGHLMLMVGLVELLVGLICVFSHATRLAASFVAWLATSFLFYRFGYVWMGYHRPCACLGNLTDALHIPPQTADTAMKIVLAYLLIGSYGILLQQWWKSKKVTVSRLATRL